MDSSQQYDMAERDAVRAEIEQEGLSELAAAAAEVTERQRVIAAIRRAADFLEEHPEYPTPHGVKFDHTLTATDEVDERIRCEAVIRWGRANDARVFEGSEAVHASVVLGDRRAQGVSIVFERWAFFDDRPRRRYVEQVERSER